MLVWGGEDLVGPRAPGLKGAVSIFGQLTPTYDIVLMVLGPVVLGLLMLLFHRTRFGILVRAATQDRDMVAALGVNQKWLFTGVFALGVFLAAFGGALQISRDAVSHSMDLPVIVETFVVVVIGGLGSVGGAFVAALLVSELNAFGILVLPTVSLVLVFVVMALVLVVRPYGLFGRAPAVPRTTGGIATRPWRIFTGPERLVVGAAVVVLAALPFVAGPYLLTVGAEILIFALFAASLQFLMSAGGMASFGHAAAFGLGAYGAALAVKDLAWPLPAALACGVAAGVAGATLIGWFCVRLSGVYFAMLTLAFAQIVWSIAFQWTAVTGGDNGMLGIWPPGWASTPAGFFWLALGIAAAGIAALRVLTFSPFGTVLRAVRDSPLRAEAVGIGRRSTQWLAFVLAGGFAALAGALFAYLKGSVFPDSLGIPTSVDGLVMVLLGGIGTVSGSVVGAVVYKALSIWLVSQTDHSKLVLGLVIVVLVVAFPQGIVGQPCGPAWRAPSGARSVRPGPGPDQAARSHSGGCRMSSRRRLPSGTAPRGRGPEQGLWRRQGRARRLLHARARRDPGPDRSQRRRQVHLFQHAERADRAGRGPRAARRAGHHGLAPRDIWRRGVGRTFQITATFGSMTVRENLQTALLSHAGRRHRPFGVAFRQERAAADALLAMVGMTGQAGRACAELAYGDLKRLELAVALTNAPSLLLMDEPTAGMAPAERIALMRLTADIARERRIGVLFTEHDMDIVFEHADRVMVLDRGELIAEGPPATVRVDPRVRATYLGEGLLYNAADAVVAEGASP